MIKNTIRSIEEYDTYLLGNKWKNQVFAENTEEAIDFIFTIAYEDGIENFREARVNGRFYYNIDQAREAIMKADEIEREPAEVSLWAKNNACFRGTHRISKLEFI